MKSLLALLLIVSVGTFTLAQEEQTAPRTAYEALDLSTPQRAAERFVEAFQAQDYPTVFWIFAPAAQRLFNQALLTFRFDLIVVLQGDSIQDDPTLDSIYLGDDPDEIEHFHVTTFFFDDLMMAADEHDAFIVDLRGAVEFGESTPGETRTGKATVDIAAEVEDVGEVTFRMIQSVSGRWRVLSVVPPGGDPDQPLWAVRR